MPEIVILAPGNDSFACLSRLQYFCRSMSGFNKVVCTYMHDHIVWFFIPQYAWQAAVDILNPNVNFMTSVFWGLT